MPNNFFWFVWLKWLLHWTCVPSTTKVTRWVFAAQYIINRFHMLACYILNSFNSRNSNCILPNQLDFTLLCLASCSDPTNHQSVDWVMLVWKSLSAAPQGLHPLLHNSLATHAVGALHCLSEKLTAKQVKFKNHNGNRFSTVWKYHCSSMNAN